MSTYIRPQDIPTVMEEWRMKLYLNPTARLRKIRDSDYEDWIDLIYSLTKSTPAANIGIPRTPEQNAHHSALMKGKKFSREHRLNISIAKKGKKQSAEHRRINSESHIGQKVSQETRDLLSILGKGRVTREETKRKIRKTMIGQKYTAERRLNMSLGKQKAKLLRAQKLNAQTLSQEILVPNFERPTSVL